MAAVALTLLPVSCSRTAPAPALPAIADEYVRLAVSLGERDPDSLDFYFGDASITGDARVHPPTLDALRAQAGSLQEKLKALPTASPLERERAGFLMAQLDAAAFRIKMLQGVNHTFDEESRTLFGVVAGADDAAAERARARDEIAKLLGVKGGAGPAHAYTVFDARFLVPPEKVSAVMSAALDVCRARTLEHIALPAGERVDVKYVVNKPWSAYSTYLGNAHSLIQVNLQFPLTVDRVFNLACHEGYPGHHVFNTMRDQALVQAAHRDEWLAQPTFSPQSFVSEAAASYAPDVAFPGDERLRVERDVLFPLAGLDPKTAEKYLRVERLVDSLHTAQPAIAREYLDGRLEFVRAADAMERETLMEHAEGLLTYLNEYRTYMLSYTVGRDMVRDLIERDDPNRGAPDSDARWQRYKQLMTQPVYSLPSPHPQAR